MQNFTQKKIALAVGASLLVMAGAAQAAAPVARATNPAVVSTTQVPGDTNTRALLSTTGLSGATVTVSFNLDSAVVVAAATDATNGVIRMVQASVAGTPITTGLVTGNATLTSNNVNVYTGTLGATTTLIPTGNTTAATFVPGVNTTGNGASSITVVIPAAATPAAFRMNAGNLEYTSNNGTTGGTAVAFAPVKIDVQSAANASVAATDRQIYTETNGTGGFTAGVDLVIAVTQTVNGTVKSSLAPTPTIKTAATAGGSLVNGFVIDTGTPVSLVAANLLVRTVANGAQTFPAAALSVSVCAASKCAVGFPGLGTVATAADFVTPVGTPDAADAAFYNSTNFNTGVTLAGANPVPFTVDGVNASKGVYSEVFNVSDGAAAKLANFGAAVVAGDSAYFPNPTAGITDGAAPTIVKAEYGTGASTTVTTDDELRLTFSEDMSFVGNPLSDYRETFENILIGTSATDRVSLAALALNSGINLQTVVPSLAAGSGQDVLKIVGVPNSQVVGKKVTVTAGIANRETNDSNYSATTVTNEAITDATTLDINAAGNDGGGIVSASTTVEAATVTDLAATEEILNIVFSTASGDAKGSVVPNGDGSKAASLDVSFGSGVKQIAFAAGKTAADLVGKIVVTVNAVDATIQPIEWQFFPVAADMTVDTTANKLNIKVAPELLNKNVAAVTGFEVRYLAAGETAAVLIKEGATDLTVATNVVDAGVVTIDPPVVMTAAALTNTLWTQSIKGKVTGAASGSRLRAYVAKFLDGAVQADVTRLGRTLATDTAAAGGATAALAVSATVGVTINTAGVTATTGSVTNPNDRVATDILLVVDNSASSDYGVAVKIGDTVQGTTTSGANTWQKANASTDFQGDQKLVDLVAEQLNNEAAGTAKAVAIPVYIALHRTNDVTANSTQGGEDHLIARATLYPTKAAADTYQRTSPTNAIYEVMLDPKTGKITGRLTGSITLKNTRFSTLPRGVNYLQADGKFGPNPVILGEAITTSAAGDYNLLLGVDTKREPAKFQPDYKDTFVLLVHSKDGTSGSYTLLNSAVANTTNFLPFELTLMNLKGERTTFDADLSKIRKVSLQNSSNWQLLGFGNWDSKAVMGPKETARFFVGIDSSTGSPKSLWSDSPAGASSTGFTGDLALSMLGNGTGFASEGATADVSTLGGKYKADAMALAFSNDKPAANDQMHVLFKPDATVTLPIGWSLVSAPSLDGLSSKVDAIIRVGAGVSQYTWIKSTDGAAPSLTSTAPGVIPVFVFSKAGVK